MQRKIGILIILVLVAMIFKAEASPYTRHVTRTVLHNMNKGVPYREVRQQIGPNVRNRMKLRRLAIERLIRAHNQELRELKNIDRALRGGK